MKKLQKILFVLLLSLLTYTVVYAEETNSSENSGSSYVIDNNGNPKDNPYGKNESIPSSFVGVDYYDCYIPYAKTVEEIGGICTAIGANNPDGYYAMPDYVKSWRVGDRTNYQGDYSSVNGVSRSGYDDTGCSIYTDSNGTKYYAMAVQKFFYNKSDSYFGWSTANRGQIIDVVFTDGTVAHFIVGDANAEQHTNGWSGGYVNEADFICNKLNYKQYKSLFSCMSGNCFELWGSSSECANGFLNKFGLKSDGSGNHVAYYRMYNAKISDPPKRSSGVPSDVSYKLDNVTIDDTTADSGNSSNSNEKITENKNPWVSEWNLRGMPKNSNISDNAGNVVLPDGGNLTNKELSNIYQIKENLNIFSLELILEVGRVIVVLLGILMYLYAIFIIIAYIFDRSNNFIDFSLLRLITFGKIDKSILEYEDGLKRILKIALLFFIIGTSILSGVLFGFIEKFISFVRGLF